MIGVLALVAGLRAGRAEPRHHDRARVDRVRHAVRGRRARAAASALVGAVRRGPGHGRWCSPRRSAGPASSRSSTRGPTRATPATRPCSRWSASARRPVRRRPRRIRAKWGYLPVRPHRLHLRDHRRGARPGRRLLVVGCCSWRSAVLGVRTAMAAPDRFGMLLAVGITAWFLVQAFINIGAVIGVLPITGVPLPFISFGGSSLLVTMAAAGLLLNVARQPDGRRAASAADWRQTRPGRYRRRRHGRPPAARPRGRRRRWSSAATTGHDPLRRQRPRRRGRARAGRGFALDELPGRGHPAPAHARATSGRASACAGHRARASASCAAAGPRSWSCSAATPASPAAWARCSAGVPLVLLEQNAKAGAANRVLRRFATAARCRSRAPTCRAAIVTGNPLRAEIAARPSAPDRAAARAELGLPADRTVIGVFSGSLGSRRINEAVRGPGRALGGPRRPRGPPRGRPARLRRRTRARHGLAEPPRAGSSTRCVEYEDRMEPAARGRRRGGDPGRRHGGRAGGARRARGARAAADRHPRPPDGQRPAVAAGGGAVVVPDAELDADRLATELDALLDDPDRLAHMAAGDAPVGAARRRRAGGRRSSRRSRPAGARLSGRHRPRPAASRSTSSASAAPG